jgi:hypothetical protein
VADRVGEDPEALLPFGREQAGAERQHRLLGPFDIVDPDVQVQLLRAPRVGPIWRHELRRPLEGQLARPAPGR